MRIRTTWAVAGLAILAGLVGCGVKAPPQPSLPVSEEKRGGEGLVISATEAGGFIRLRVRAPWPATFVVTKRAADCPRGKVLAVAMIAEREAEVIDRARGRRIYRVTAVARTGAAQIEKTLVMEGRGE